MLSAHPSSRPILVVDDEPDVRELLVLLLELEGYVVIEAENGVQAIAQALQHDIQLAIFDVTMPVMDGIQAATTVRKSKPLVHLIFHTAMDESYVRKRFTAHVGYLAKPAESDQIVKKVTELMQ